MAPLEDEWETDEDEIETPSWVTETEDDDSSTTFSLEILLSIVPLPVPYTVMGSTTPTNNAIGPVFTGVMPPSGRPRPDGYPSDRPWPPYTQPTSTTESWQTSISATTPYADHMGSSLPWTTSTSTSKLSPKSSQSLTNPHGERPSGWDFERKHANKAPMYAAAVVIPIVVLAIIAGVTLVCLRKRKRRKAEEAVAAVAVAAAAAAAQNVPQEMKMQPPKLNMHPQLNAQPYMAPPPGSPPPPTISVSRNPPNHLLPPTSTSSAFQPIILGPIGTDSSNGAYLTGIDTSDMVSITSNTLRPVDNPFSDNNSLTEPPPPYRPYSASPPSFTTNSRHSSLRAGDSQIRLIEGDPFDDPDDDSVSDLSEPTYGRDRDGISVVSDLSYQRFT
ncbi:hypothetical protein G6011_05104 [Alternaria panax]|uniref:Uncharacterized protein n=1 Tax=Alternaria panax TaxID=48097 RepID=A0AAD4FE72_9PLEO|nr:hypothetical protein G6011_05104 [Alternaria panax]